MRKDNQGLFYYDESSKGREIFFVNDTKKKKPESVSSFYELLNNNDLIIKRPNSSFDIEKLKYMLERFAILSKKILLTDLPTSYYVESDEVKGLVVPYYRNTPSLYSLLKPKQLSNIMDYYQKGDDELRNLFLLINDVINILEELKDNGIIYCDTNPSNIVFSNNEVKLIDFDPEYNRVYFDINKKSIKDLLEEIDRFVFLVLKKAGLYDLPIYNARDFTAMRKHLVKVENRIRKRYYV